MILIKNHGDRIKAIKEILGADPKKTYVFNFRQITNPRTLDQNALYWAWLAIAEMETGQDKQSIHAHLKNELGVETTSTLDTKSFSEFATAAKNYLITVLKVDLRSPGDPQFDEWYQQYEAQR
jgi:hypothetical protein